MSPIARQIVGEAEEKPGLSQGMRAAALGAVRSLRGRDLESLHHLACFKGSPTDTWVNPYRVHAVTVEYLASGMRKVYITFGNGDHRWFGPFTREQISAIEQWPIMDHVGNNNWHTFDEGDLDPEFIKMFS